MLRQFEQERLQLLPVIENDIFGGFSLNFCCGLLSSSIFNFETASRGGLSSFCGSSVASFVCSEMFLIALESSKVS